MSVWAPILISLAALYLGESVRRKTRAEVEQQVAARRIEAYSELWSKTPVAMSAGGPQLDSPQSRRELFDSLTTWYFAEGNGMVLSEDTRNIYLTAKENLICQPKKLKPASLGDRIAQLPAGERELELGKAATRQFSLLRTSMRADLLVFTGPWGQRLGRGDRRFLRACGVRQWKRPWRPSLFGARLHDPATPLAPADAPAAGEAVPT